tara:strand:+ start:2741 stop:2959 length:219 start_codon:yes stop_codon:yes gene_type:complete
MSSLLQTGTLRRAGIPREEFNPGNNEHRASLRKFLLTGNWGDIQFFAEEPYISVPETVMRKMALRGMAMMDD